MNGAAAYAAQRPVFGSLAATDDTQHRKAAIAFRAMGADRRGGLCRNQRLDLRHDARFPLAPLSDGGGLNTGRVARCPWFEAIEMALRVRDRPVRPGKSDSPAPKCGAIDANGFEPGTPDFGMPRINPGVDALDGDVAMETGHFGGPRKRSQETAPIKKART